VNVSINIGSSTTQRHEFGTKIITRR